MCALLFSFVFKQVSNQFTKMSKQHRNNRLTSLNFRPPVIMECRPTSADRSLIILQLPLYLFIIALWFPRCYTLEPAPEVNHWTTPVRQTNRQNTRRVSTQIMASLSFPFSNALSWLRIILFRSYFFLFETIKYQICCRVIVPPRGDDTQCRNCHSFFKPKWLLLSVAVCTTRKT